MKSKPAKYGIKIWVSADVNTYCTHNMWMYTGKKEGEPQEQNQSMRVVRDLEFPLFGTGRGVTTDNFFTSCQLAEYLLTRNLTLTGTMRNNKPDIPKIFINGKEREVFSSLFRFDGNLTLTSYVPRKNDTDILLSSQHHDKSCMGESQAFKPAIITHYNATKGGVDVVDKLTREYMTCRGTRWWPVRLFCNMLDVSCMNAFVLWLLKHPEWKINVCHHRRHFCLNWKIK
jgi:hypothetical protein